MYKLIRQCFLVLCASIIQINMSFADNALYKTFSLDKVDALYFKGFISVDVQKGSEDNVEVFIDKARAQVVTMGTETVGTKSTFYIKDNTQTTSDSGEISPFLHAVITLRELKDIQAHDIHRLNVSGFNAPQFALKVSGYSNVHLHENTINIATITVAHMSLLQATNNRINNVEWFLKGQSKVALSDFANTSFSVDLRDHSRISLTGIDATTFTAFGTYTTKLFMKDSVVDNVYLSGNRDAVMDLQSTVINVCELFFFQNAQVYLGDVSVVTATLRDKVRVFYSGEPIVHKTLIGDATIAPYEHSRIPPHG